MQALYVVSVWLHILAAVTWIGGMFFLVLVVVPWLRKGDRAKAAAFLRETGVRFRDVGWTCFAILLVTGTFNLWARGVRLHHLIDPAWITSPFGSAVAWKFGLFIVVVAVSAWHDFWLGPLAAAVGERDPHGPEAEKLRRLASKVGRLNVLLALALVAFAVIIVRGWPF